MPDVKVNDIVSACTYPGHSGSITATERSAVILNVLLDDPLNWWPAPPLADWCTLKHLAGRGIIKINLTLNAVKLSGGLTIMGATHD